jgi:hypothetical protein
MQPHSDATTHLETFTPPLARAVVEVLRQGGIPAWADEESGRGAGELAVRVPDGLREEAFVFLASRMDEVHRLAADDPDGETDGHAAERPIVMERFRSLGFLALLLAPLLVVTLASPRLPRPLALIVLVGGMAAIVAWRNRQSRDEE